MEPLAQSDPDRIASYELLGRLGAGGMGLVYKARSPGGRLVAVKVIHKHLTDDPLFLSRFRREVEAARSVSGFYTAPVIAADTDGSPAWLATAYVPGPSLGAEIRDRGPMPARRVTELAAALAEALKAVHAAGIVHRDLKPSNILLADDGPRVIDFGIARAVDGTRLTGGIIGTPEYMAPEQVEADGEIGPASDVFALGGVLYYAATGRPPFGSGDLRAVLYRVQTAEADLEPVPAELRDLIGRCLAKEPSLRPTPDEILARTTAPLAGDQAGGQRNVQVEERKTKVLESTTGAAPPPEPEPGPKLAPEPETRVAPEPGPETKVAPEPEPRTAPLRRPHPEPPTTAAPAPPSEAPSRVAAWIRRRGWVPVAAVALVGTAAFVVLDLDGAGRGGGFRPWSVAGAHGTPVVADGLAYVGLKDGVAAHDARTGERRWKSGSQEPEQVVARHGAVLLVRSGTRLSALDPKTGNRLWRLRKDEDGCVALPASSGRVMVADENGRQDAVRVSGVESATGARVWSKTIGGSPCTPSAAITDDGVAVVEDGADGKALVSLAAESGESRRISTGEVLAVTTDGSTVYAVTKTKDGRRIRAYAADTGRHRWDAALPDPNGSLDLVAEDSRLHVLVAGALYAFRSSDGHRLWKSPLPDKDYADFVVADGTAYVVWDDSDTRLLNLKTVRRTSLAAIDTATGRRLWHKRIEAVSSIATAGGRAVFVASHTQHSFRPDDRSLIAFDGRTGRERWKRELDVRRGMESRGGISVASGVLYIFKDDSELAAVDAATGDGP